ncbi:VOC family protein, partial [Streptomyces sp. WAC00469]|uniref:VOC family protein n=1 Tax=Streptomyces sp. WAC00469 TaxID=2487415 RepID=UPI0037DDCBD1
MWQMAVGWTPYFAVPSADDAVARVQERGGTAAVASMWQMAVAWTPYFAVPSADDAVARVQERGGTAAV